MDTKYVNMVFQGGGVRGIAYAGVLDKMPSNIRVKSVGGTSAGALVAALIAIGKIKGLAEILSDQELFKLVSETDQKRIDKLKAAWKKLEKPLDVLTSDAAGQVKTWGATRDVFKQVRSLRKELAKVWKDRGVARSSDLKKWLGKIFGGTTFSDVKRMGHVEDLRIVAADVSLHRFKVFHFVEDPTTALADAVLASVSIPGFFNPFQMGSNCFVDGGVLSNFPSFLFAQKSFPTIGFRLEDVPALSRLEHIQAKKNIPLPLDTTFEYLWAMLGTMMDAHDNHRGTPSNFHPVTIETPASIPSTKFNLTREDADALFTKGQAAAARVDWKNWPASEPQKPFDDPKPNDALRVTMQFANQMLTNAYKRSRWVDNLAYDLTFRARITKDWSGHYEKIGIMRVTGAGQITASRLSADGIPGTASSLVDHLPVWQEEIDGAWSNLPLIPLSNEEEAKGFVALYDPPVQDGQPPRKFRSAYRIPQEFEKTLADGTDGKMTYGLLRNSKNQDFDITFEIEVDAELPMPDLKPNFEPGFMELPDRIVDGRVYHVRQRKFAKAKFEPEFYLEVKLKAKQFATSSGS